jgi:hypothetical protein
VKYIALLDAALNDRYMSMDLSPEAENSVILLCQTLPGIVHKIFLPRFKSLGEFVSLPLPVDFGASTAFRFLLSSVLLPLSTCWLCTTKTALSGADASLRYLFTNNGQLIFMSLCGEVLNSFFCKFKSSVATLERRPEQALP